MKLRISSNVSSLSPAYGAEERISASMSCCWNGAATAIARMCWASTSSAPGRKVSGSSSPSPIASRASRASRYSKRLPGTMMPLLGSGGRGVGGHDDPLAGLVDSVVGAADPREQARAALGRTHLDDQIDVAPVDSEVE